MSSCIHVAVSPHKHIPEKCLDILDITETWLREGGDCHINNLSFSVSALT